MSRSASLEEALGDVCPSLLDRFPFDWEILEAPENPSEIARALHIPEHGTCNRWPTPQNTHSPSLAPQFNQPTQLLAQQPVQQLSRNFQPGFAFQGINRLPPPQAFPSWPYAQAGQYGYIFKPRGGQYRYPQTSQFKLESRQQPDSPLPSSQGTPCPGNENRNSLDVNDFMNRKSSALNLPATVRPLQSLPEKLKATPTSWTQARNPYAPRAVQSIPPTPWEVQTVKKRKTPPPVSLRKTPISVELQETQKGSDDAEDSDEEHLRLKRRRIQSPPSARPTHQDTMAKMATYIKEMDGVMEKFVDITIKYSGFIDPARRTEAKELQTELNANLDKREAIYKCFIKSNKQLKNVLAGKVSVHQWKDSL